MAILSDGRHCVLLFVITFNLWFIIINYIESVRLCQEGNLSAQRKTADKPLQYGRLLR